MSVVSSIVSIIKVFLFFYSLKSYFVIGCCLIFSHLRGKNGWLLNYRLYSYLSFISNQLGEEYLEQMYLLFNNHGREKERGSISFSNQSWSNEYAKVKLVDGIKKYNVTDNKHEASCICGYFWKFLVSFHNFSNLNYYRVIKTKFHIMFTSINFDLYSVLLIYIWK